MARVRCQKELGWDGEKTEGVWNGRMTSYMGWDEDEFVIRIYHPIHAITSLEMAHSTLTNELRKVKW